MLFDIQAYDTLIKNRRSVFPKDYTGEVVDDAIVEKIVESALWAPTHKMTQPWRFIIFTGAGLQSLAEAQASLYKRVAERDGSFREDKYQNLLTKPLLSSHIVVVLMKRDEKQSVPEIEEVGAVFCAVENMYLSATAYGVGGYLSTGGVTYFEGVKELFGLNEDDKFIGFFHIGVPKSQPSALKRKSFGEVVQWVRA
ncbi:MAG TPA: nitroreductase [Chryseosolibacter sp.]|nr:nitroreductase [Chryseosolibacter sp.]